MRATYRFPICYILTILLTALICCPTAGLGQSDSSATPKLYLQNRQIDPLNESLQSKILPSQESPSPQLDSSAKRSIIKELTRLFSISTPTVLEDEYKYYIVQFTGPIQPTWKTSLTELGAKFYDYIPQYAFIIKLDTSKVTSVEKLGFVRWIGEYVADLKLSQGIYDITPDDLQKQNQMLNVRVVAFPGENVDAISNKITEAGGIVLSSSSSEWNILFDVKIPIQNIKKLKDIMGVKWIEQAPKHRTNNNIALKIIQARSPQERTWPVSNSQLFGEGQIIAVCDSGIDTGYPDTLLKDFSDGLSGSRVTNNVFSGASITDKSGHGTHVAGIIAGNGMLSGASPATNNFPSTCYAGAAPKAQLYVQSVGAGDGGSSLPGIPSSLADLFQPAYDAGARIHTNSWGTSGAGGYDNESLTVDQFMWSHKDFLVLFAAGNAGYDKDMNGVTDPYCIDTPATAKNCLSVGASESYRTKSGEGFATSSWSTFRTYAEPIASDITSDKPYGLAAFSSRGPTMDGRYKPEIIAPGTNILSTRSSQQVGNGWGAFNDNYYWSGGTSMATPLVAGTAALMREYLMKEEGMSTPSAALIKTSLIHGADALIPGQYGTGAGQESFSVPDNVQGWGRINFEASINSDNRYTTKFIDIKGSDAPTDTSYSKSFSFEVENDEKPFRATLGWTDYPGSTVTSGGLVNDLDLRVQQPDGTWVYPDNAIKVNWLNKEVYVDSVVGFYTGKAVGLKVTPPQYPCILQSVDVAFKNANSLVSDVSIVVYTYNGSVGDEIYRKKFAYIPSGEYGFPIGLTIEAGELVVAVEKESDQLGVYCATGNSTGRGLVNSGGTWQTASITPAIIANYSTKILSTNFDRLNNTVSINIKKPQPGTYMAEVTAHNIPMGPQPYALVLSGMTGDVPVYEDIELNPNQPNAPISTLLTENNEVQPAVTVNSAYGTKFDAVYSQQHSFSILTPAGSVISMRYPVSGLPNVAASQLTLTKLLANGTHRPFSYAAFEDYRDGKWWFTDISGKYISPVEKLTSTSTYYVVSAIQDGGSYDEDVTPGRIDDPQILGMTPSTSSTEGGGGGGCTIGEKNDYTLALLVLFAILSLILRRYFVAGQRRP
ncbi:S8 family serine peptidase [Halodesulfovibrio aestuarii]|uniref:S8 family serine peptidase n=1 Tax=Halodesulfovibrio aestuarii TaxID=126333 RepID=UPI003D340621